jgi:DNA-binding LytR/AlgR family response regulator
MIKAVIIEDERYAANYLLDLIKEIALDIQIVGLLENVEESINKLPKLNPDLVFADIHLEDGQSFSIFEKLNWKKPVIFITAYDAYAIKAFKSNGIDYILKPCEKDELEIALNKFRNSFGSDYNLNLIESLNRINVQAKNSYKERFAITLGNRIISISTNQISYFFYSNRITYLVTFEGKKYPYNESLDSLYVVLDPNHFFRINRNYIANHIGIEKIEVHAGRQIDLTLKPLPAEGIVAVSKDRISEFKNWLDK